MKDYWRVARVLEGQHGVATRAQLLAAGVTRHELTTAVATGLFVRVQPNVYRLRGSQPSTDQLLLAACLSAGADASHRSAAALWNVPAPRPPKPEIVCAKAHHPRVQGVILHRTDRLDRADRTTLHGIPTTALARTVLDLGAVVRPWEVELAMEEAVLRIGTSIRAFRDCLERIGANGRNGTGVLRQILESRDPDVAGAEGALNQALQRLFRRHGLQPRVPEYRLRGPGGERIRVDFAWPSAMLAVEGDSVRWHAGRLDVHRNARKANVLVNLGWSVYHYTSIDVRYRSADVTAEIGGFLARHAA